MADNQTISFPFLLERITISISGIKRKCADRSYIIALTSDAPLADLPWSESLSSHFLYLPQLIPDNTAVIEAKLGSSVNSLTFRIQPWSSDAPMPEMSFRQFNMSATGVAGEERRRYQVDYEYILD